MSFFTNAIDVLQTLVIALGGGLCVWGGINLLEGYGQDNPSTRMPRIPLWATATPPCFWEARRNPP